MTTQQHTAESLPTLVTGGTGKTGRRIAERLTQRGLPARIGSRSVEPPFSWEDPATWGAALEGVGGVYICFQPDLAFPGAAETVGRFARLAVSKGVTRLVVLSGRGEAGAEAAERAVQEAGAEWTVVRCSWFNQNFSEGFFLEPVLAGELVVSTGDAVEPFVDAEDIADVAAAALTEPGHSGEIYELAGPRLLSFGEAVREVSAACGRDIGYVPVTSQEYRGYLRENGVPEEFADLFDTVLDGRNAHVADGVERALGRKPRDFAVFAAEAAATGVWTP